jgi:hypothetical protein
MLFPSNEPLPQHSVLHHLRYFSALGPGGVIARQKYSTLPQATLRLPWQEEIQSQSGHAISWSNMSYALVKRENVFCCRALLLIDCLIPSPLYVPAKQCSSVFSHLNGTLTTRRYSVVLIQGEWMVPHVIPCNQPLPHHSMLHHLGYFSALGPGGVIACQKYSTLPQATSRLPWQADIQ